MKRIIPILILTLSTLLMLNACAPRVPEPWQSALAQFNGEAQTCEVLLVAYEGGSNATVRFYERASSSNWKLLGETDALVGKNGIGKTREGDAMTPEGTFKVTGAFGVLPDPGTALPYTNVTSSIFACDEEGPWYNKIIDTAATHHSCKGEDMFHTVPEYNYGLELDYNPGCVYPLGSAIFFHCKGAKAWTGGCIAVDEAFMMEILIKAKPGLSVCIFRR